MRRDNKNKLRLIGMLMIVSLVMLAGFIGKWLTVQYADEKVNLRNNLENIYAKTNDSIIDSLIEVSIALPLGPDDTVKQVVIPRTARTFMIDSLQEIPRLTMDIHGKRPYGSMPLPIANGMRRFIAKINAHSINADSAKMIVALEKNLHSKDLAVNATWTTDSTHGIVITTDRQYKIKIDGYQPILFKKILPQISFSVLLLLLCSCAFILSYNTVRKQIRLSAQKDSFISNMSHELKTPVATAKVAIEALRNFNALEDPVKTKDYLQMASWEIDRLETLVGNVLNSMQLEEGRIVMKKEPVDTIPLLKDILNSMNPLFIRHGKQITTRYDLIHAITEGDKTHLQGAFYNIIDNAVKYGGDQIKVAVWEADGKAMISISDNGQGIPAEYSRKVFERFFRIPSGNVHDVKGYGLGLNYTRYVIISHDGDIYQQNNAAGGAEFVISLPLQKQS